MTVDYFSTAVGMYDKTSSHMDRLMLAALGILAIVVVAIAIRKQLSGSQAISHINHSDAHAPRNLDPNCTQFGQPTVEVAGQAKAYELRKQTSSADPVNKFWDQSDPNHL